MNAAKVVKLTHDRSCATRCSSATCCWPTASRWCGPAGCSASPLPERVAGIDLFEALLDLADRERLRVYLLGATPEVLDRRRGRSSPSGGPALEIAGSRDGYFERRRRPTRSPREIAALGRRHAVPRHDHADEGDLPRARYGRPAGRAGPARRRRLVRRAGRRHQARPRALAALGMEWAYRLLQEPRRLWRRYLVTNTAFLAPARCGERHPPTPPGRTCTDPPQPRTRGSTHMDEIFNGRVAVIGLGYIGLPTAVALATRGIEVVGVDVNEATVEAVVARRGAVRRARPRRRASAARSRMGRLDRHHQDARRPTPSSSPCRRRSTTTTPPTCRYVRAAVEQIAPRLRGGEVVVLESTSPPGHDRAGEPVAGGAAARPDRCRTPRRACPTTTSPTARSGCCPAGS